MISPVIYARPLDHRDIIRILNNTKQRWVPRGARAKRTRLFLLGGNTPALLTTAKVLLSHTQGGQQVLQNPLPVPHQLDSHTLRRPPPHTGKLLKAFNKSVQCFE
jgi:hypothetical protein